MLRGIYNCKEAVGGKGFRMQAKQCERHCGRGLLRALMLVAVLYGVGAEASAQSRIEYKWRGFYSTLDYSYAFNINRSPDDYNVGDTLSAHVFSFSSGFQFRKEAGVGAGVAFVSDPNGAFTQLPLFLELRSHYTRNRLTPYSVFQFGYSFPVGSSSEPPSIKITTGGLYVGIDLGARFAVDRYFAFAAHVGYKMLQSNHVQRTDLSGISVRDEALLLHMVSMGVSFYF